jgi:photosystem II stability/assembly factor-like uncharacterized protein
MARATTQPRPRAARPGTRSVAKPGARGIPRRILAVGALLVLAAVVAAVFLVRSGSQPGGAIATLHTSDFHALAFSPDDPNAVFFGHHNGIMRSDDGGRTWRPLVERRNFDAMALAVSRGDPRALFLAGHDIFQVSKDAGATWQPVAHNLSGTDIHGFAMSPNDPHRLYAFVVGHGVFASADGGKTWQPVGGQVPGDVHALASAGGNPETLYAGSMRAGVLRSTDGGRSWAAANGGLGTGGVMALAVDPVDPRTIYAGAGAGLYKSTDSGATWSKLPYPGESAVTLAVSPSNPNVVLTVAVKGNQGLVYHSEDGGRTWGGRP